MKVGDSGYTKIHDLVKYYFGKPKKCECCGVKGRLVEVNVWKTYQLKKGKRWSIVWSNVDHKHKERRSNWRGLCQHCHGAYDHKLSRWYDYADKPYAWRNAKRRNGILPKRHSPSLDKQREWLKRIRRSKGLTKVQRVWANKIPC